MTTPAHPDMAWHLRRLLEAVKEAACGLEGRWGWLGAPMALLMWIRTRRERREAAEAMAAVQGLLQGFLTLLEEFRAGRLAPEEAAREEEAPSLAGAPCEVNEADGAVALGPPRPARAGEGANGASGAGAYPSPSRCAGPAPRIKSAGKPALKGRGIQGWPVACARMVREGANDTAGAVVGHIGLAPQWIPAAGSSPGASFHIAGMTGTVSSACAVAFSKNRGAGAADYRADNVTLAK